MQRSSPDLEVAATTSVDTLEARELLCHLLQVAADTDLADHVAWTRLRTAARTTVVGLIDRDQLPLTFAIAEHEPPVVVARTLAAAWRCASMHAEDDRP